LRAIDRAEVREQIAEGVRGAGVETYEPELCLCNLIAKVDPLTGKCRAEPFCLAEKFFTPETEKTVLTVKNGVKNREQPPENRAKRSW